MRNWRTSGPPVVSIMTAFCVDGMDAILRIWVLKIVGLVRWLGGERCDWSADSARPGVEEYSCW